MPINHIKTSTVADGTDANLIRPGDWNSAHAYTLQDAVSLIGNNTQGVLANISSGTLYLAGGANIMLSQNANSVTIGHMAESSYENFQPAALQTMTVNATSLSHCVAFILHRPGSYSFLRLPVSFTTNSTTLATTGATLSASCGMFSTWNAVVYSLGTGISSKSLMSVASGSAGFTFMNSVSMAVNGTQGSYSQFFSARVEGGGTTVTTQYSASTSNMPFSTTAFGNCTGARFLDIPFDSSLKAGAFWLVFGYSSSSATNSTGISAATNCNVRYSNHYGASQINSNFGVMGSTNLTSGGLMGAGSFSTAGGGTTAAFPISAISSSVSNVRPYFQLLRSA